MKKHPQKHQKISLSQQILTNFSLALMTVGLSTLWVNYHLVSTNVTEQMKKRAQSITQSLEFATEGLIQLEYAPILRRVVQNYATLPAVMEVAIVDSTGLILAHSISIEKGGSYAAIYPELDFPMKEAANTGVETSVTMEIHSQPVLVYILPFSSVLFGNSGQRGLAIAIINLQEMQQEVLATFFSSTLTFFMGTLLILLIVWLLIQFIVLNPIQRLHSAVANSKESGSFYIPNGIQANEIGFLASTFETVFRQLETYEKLQKEIAYRQQVQAALVASETREREKAKELEQTLQELKQTQAQLIQTEKMSSLGQMVGGIAHEINNPVNFIHGNIVPSTEYVQDLLRLIDLYQKTYPNPSPQIEEIIEEIDLDFVKEDLIKILESMTVGTQRIRDIVLSLRNFSRLDESEIKSVNVHEGIESTLLILQHRLKEKVGKKGINLIKKYGELPLVECSPSQLNQVFMNILSNAIDALESGIGIHATPSDIPTISIITEFLEPKKQIEIRIQDNGKGMSEEVKSRLFDPFFTTKPIGKGTGLGLSIAFQIVVDKHQGEIICLSELEKKTEFVIRVPIQHEL